MAIYNGKHCVFEQVGVEGSDLQWNTGNNPDGDGATNDWNISTMMTTHLPTRLLMLSSDLQSIITNTTIQTATNGNSDILVSTSDKLFLAAEKEMRTETSYANNVESNALTTRTYWTTHTTNNDRVKTDPSNVAQKYRLRSPYLFTANRVVLVSNDGAFGVLDTSYTRRFAPCFAF